MKLTLAIAAVIGVSACSGSDKPYYIPVDTPAKPFAPPETEDLAGDDATWDGDDDDDDDDDGADATDPAAAVQAVVMTLVQSRRAFENCYRQALKRAPTLRGRVELALTIGADGVPTKSTATGISGVDRCVAEVAKGLVFPKPPGGQPISISHPFVFAPSS